MLVFLTYPAGAIVDYIISLYAKSVKAPALSAHTYFIPSSIESQAAYVTMLIPIFGVPIVNKFLKCVLLGEISQSSRTYLAIRPP